MVTVRIKILSTVVMCGTYIHPLSSGHTKNLKCLYERRSFCRCEGTWKPRGWRKSHKELDDFLLLIVCYWTGRIEEDGWETTACSREVRNRDDSLVE